MHESQYTRNVMSRLPVGFTHWKINDNFEGGVPDSHIRAHGYPGCFIEWKYLDKCPKRESTIIVPKLSELQKRWLASAHNPPYCLAFVGLGVNVNGTRLGVLLTLEQATEGVSVGHIIANGMKYAALASFIAGTIKGESVK